jgi:hypothetical protein
MRIGGAALVAASALVAAVAICAPVTLADSLTAARQRLVGFARLVDGDALVVDKVGFLPSGDPYRAVTRLRAISSNSSPAACSIVRSTSTYLIILRSRERAPGPRSA